MSEIVFGPNTDYTEVYEFSKEMFSDISANKGCCHIAKVKAALCKAAQYLKGAELALLYSDTPRFDDAVKISYLTLIPFHLIDYSD